MEGKKVRKVVGWVSALCAVASVVFSRWGFAEGFTKCSRVKVAQAFILAAWIVLPPVWFWLEYYMLYLPKPASYEGWEQYKYGQELSSKIWLALVTTLLGLYFGKDLAPR